MAQMKMGTYNINGLVGGNFYLIKLMKENDFNVICLQETKVGDMEKSHKEIKEIITEENNAILEKYELLSVECLSPKGHGGCAIYYKKDKEIPTYNFEHSDELFGRILTVEYEQFYLINAYMPNSNKSKEDKKKYLKRLIDLPCKLDKPCIILGDMNVKKDYRDKALPKERSNAGTFNFEINLFQELLDKGFVDVFSYLYPTDEAVAEHLKSAPDIYENWYRLDYILLSEQLTKNIVDCKIHTDFVYRRYNSTHLPIEMVIDI